MNRDEIEKMLAGHEMDALIAENLFEWERFTPEGCPSLVLHPIYKNMYFPFNECSLIYKDDKNNMYYVDAEAGCYSTDISAAWEVVEKLKEKWDIVDLWFEKDTGFNWWCEIVRNGDGENANADTAPLAICRAALLATLKE